MEGQVMRWAGPPLVGATVAGIHDTSPRGAPQV